MKIDLLSVQLEVTLERIPSGHLSFREVFGGLHCGFYFKISLTVCLLSPTNDAEQFFEKMEERNSDTYNALMVGLYKVCTYTSIDSERGD